MEINWLDWGKAAFQRSKNEKKPVLLGISAVWCHWCHTMDKLTYKNADVIAFINQNFTPVRVDTDKRPDVNERYNVGGWPSTVVLSATGAIVAAATYVPPEKMISFLQDALVRLKKFKSVKKSKGTGEGHEPFNSDTFYSEVKSFFDPVNGGFGLEPKFPHHELIEYLLWRVGARKDKSAKEMLDMTFLKMAQSELFDHGGGGFFRYATVQNWTIPHFEKMLEGNARFLAEYTVAYRLFGRDEYRTILNKTIFWLFTAMFDKERGVFYGSQDADEQFCRLSFEKRVRVEFPFVDKTIYTDANAMLALALFELSSIEPDYEPVAFRLLESLYKLNVRGLVAHYYPAETPVYVLKDHVYLLGALVHAYVRTGKLEWRAKALTVAKHLEKFYDKKLGGFWDVLASKDAVGKLKERSKPVNENAFAAIMLEELAKASHDDKWRKMSQKTLQALSGAAVEQGTDAAMYAIAFEVL